MCIEIQMDVYFGIVKVKLVCKVIGSVSKEFPAGVSELILNSNHILVKEKEKYLRVSLGYSL
jgi:hypothetical protein